MKTAHSLDKIKWHLENNVQPKLNEKAASSILKTLGELNESKVELTDTLTPDTDCTIAEMCDDLRIELIED